MSRKHKLDFIIYEDDDEQIIFRFYPRRSSCHSFNDKPPTNWEGVYKVYYSYRILRKWKDEDNDIEELFNSNCDECSVMSEVAARIKYIIEGEKSVIIIRDNKKYIIELFNNEINPYADGVRWIINKTNNIHYEIYEIMLWNSSNIGYRFYLGKEQLKEFGKYLNYCCEYMLKHGESI